MRNAETRNAEWEIIPNLEEAFLKEFKGSKSIKVKVEGTVKGSTLKVTSIKAG